MATKITEAQGLAKLREPFPPNQISKLPKETRSQIDARKANKSLMVWKCPECGGPHHKDAVHLDYVGHAAATDRLLDTDLEWTWEPLAVDALGLPAFDQNGGLWIKLTVCGVTRLGYGSADGKSGGDAKKEIIGDAIRNAGMRFGMALDLWHKGDLHAEGDEAEALIDDAQFATLVTLIESKAVDTKAFCGFMKVDSLKDIPASRYEEAVSALKRKRDPVKPRPDPVPNPQRSEELADEIPY